jgi:hypothetical protein
MWFVVAGVAVLIAGTVDLVWTTLGTHGGGPISAPIGKLIWKAMIGLHRQRRHHRALSFGGSVILLSLIALWLVLIWTGWTLVFSGSDLAVVQLQSRRPADLAQRIYFTGATMFTAGTSEFAPGSHIWQIATAVACASGLFVVTLSITYLLSVLAAIVEKRALASMIWDMGGTPDRLVERAWTGETWAPFDNPMTLLMTGIERFAESQLAYPILQYFHAENHRTAEPLRIAALYETLLLIAKGAAADSRPSKLITESALQAIRGFAEVIADEYVAEPDDPPPPPDLEILRSRSIPVVDAESFRAAVESARDVRRRLLGMIVEGGWEWKDVFETKLKPD